MKFIKDATERVLATAVMLAAAIASVEAVIASTGLLQSEYQQITAIAGVTIVLNIIKVLAAAKTGDKGTASLAAEDRPTDDVIVETVPETDEELPETDASL